MAPGEPAAGALAAEAGAVESVVKPFGPAACIAAISPPDTARSQ